MTTLKTLARTTLIAAPVALMGGAAFAGGLAEPVVVVEPAPVVAAPVMMGNDWTGFYVGGQLGWGDVDLGFLPDDADYDFSGALYGVHAGYLYDFGSFVAGAEVDWDATNMELEVEGEDTGVNVESVARAKLIAGFDAGNVMPYLTGGWANASLDGDGEEAEDTGTFLGAGVSYAATDSIRVGAEVLQHSFEDFDDAEGFDFDVTTATLRVSFAF